MSATASASASSSAADRGSDKAPNITAEEANRIEQCMKQPEFRKLFEEYVKEIADPKNKQEYENYIASLERGDPAPPVGHPTPWFCIKTICDKKTGKETKFFLNCLHSGGIKDKTIQPQSSGSSDLPCEVGSVQPCFDHAGQPAYVCDIVFSTTTKALATADPRIQELVVRTAFDNVEAHRNVKLKKQKATVLQNMKYKPAEQSKTQEASRNASTTRKTETQSTAVRPDVRKNDGSQAPLPTPSPASASKPTNGEDGQTRPEVVEPLTSSSKENEADSNNGVAHPADTVQYRVPVHALADSGADIVLTIELPDCKSAATIQTTIGDTTVELTDEVARYHLQVVMPCAVNADTSTAKFNARKKTLTLTLSPLRPRAETIAAEAQTAAEMADGGISASASATNAAVECSPMEAPTPEQLPVDPLSNKPEAAHATAPTEIAYISAPAVATSVPQYKWRQDENSISCVLLVPGVDAQSVIMQPDDTTPNGCTRWRISMNTNGVAYNMILRLISAVKRTGSSQNVAASNVLFQFSKAVSGEWKQFGTFELRSIAPPPAQEDAKVESSLPNPPVAMVESLSKESHMERRDSDRSVDDSGSSDGEERHVRWARRLEDIAPTKHSLKKKRKKNARHGSTSQDDITTVFNSPPPPDKQPVKAALKRGRLSSSSSAHDNIAAVIAAPRNYSDVTSVFPSMLALIATNNDERPPQLRRFAHGSADIGTAMLL